MIKPSAKQRLAIHYLSDRETNFVGYGGAAFGGKSYLLCRWITTMCLKYPGTGWGIGRRQLTTLLKTTVVTLHKVFKEMNLTKDVHYTYNGQLRVYTFDNESQIFLIDMASRPSDPWFTRFGGYELTGAAVDESVEVEKKAIEILFTRLGRRMNHEYGLTAKLLETFNPAKNHVFKRYWLPYKEGRLPDDYKFVRALPKDNPSPEVEAYITNILKVASDVTIQRLIHGNFDFEDDPTVLMDYAARLDLFSNYHISGSVGPENRFITADIAVHGSDSFVIMVWYGWRIVEIKKIPKSGGREIIDTLKDLMKKHKIRSSNLAYDRDGVGAFIGGRGGYIPGAVGFVNNAKPIKRNEKDEDEKDQYQYENLKAQCGYLIAKKVNAREIYVGVEMSADEETKFIEHVGQIRRGSITEERKLTLKRKKDIIQDIGESPDYGDAFLMRYIFELRPKPTKRKVRRIKL